MKKKLLLFAAVLVLLMLPAAWLNTQQGIFYGDGFLRRTATGYGPITMIRQEDATQFTGTIDGFSYAGTICRDGDTMTVTFPDDTIVTGTWNGAYLCDQSGLPYAFSADMITIYVGNEPTPPSRTAQANLLCRMEQEDVEQRGSLWCVFLGLVCYVLGMLSVLFPEQMHFFGGRWQYDYAELSDAGRFAQQLGGWFCMGASLFIMYMPLFSFMFN